MKISAIWSSVLSSNKFKCNIPLLCMISKEMVSDLYMLGLRVLHEFFDMLMALVLSHFMGT